MHSCAWMNGQHQQVGPNSQSSQAATLLPHGTMITQQPGMVNNSNQYRTVTSGAQPPQMTHFNVRDGALLQQQTSALSHQTFSSHWPAHGNHSKYSEPLMEYSTDVQNGNPHHPVTGGLQVGTLYDFYQNSVHNSKTQISPNMTVAYPQQDQSTHRNQPATFHWKKSAKDGYVGSDVQQLGQKRWYLNGKIIKLPPAYGTTAASVPYEKAVRQSSHYHSQRQNVNKNGFSPSIQPPPYSTSGSQSVRNNISAMTSPSNGQMWTNSSISQKTQQYNLAHSSGGVASSVNSNLRSCQLETSSFFQRMNGHPINPAISAQQKLLNLSADRSITEILDTLHNIGAAGSNCHPPVNTSSPHTETMTMANCNQTMQPVTSAISKSCNSNATHLSPLGSVQYLPNTNSSMTKTQHSVDAPQEQSSLPDGICVTTTVKGSKAGTGNLVGSSNDAPQLMQLLETQSSVNNNDTFAQLEMLSLVKQHDGSMHSSPGRTGTRAVAVVLPLSQESYQVVTEHTSIDTASQYDDCTATDKSQSDLGKLDSSLSHEKHKETAHLTERVSVSPENPNQTRCNKSVVTHSVAFNNTVSNSHSFGPQDLSHEQLFSDENELVTNIQVEQCTAPAAGWPETSKKPVNQNGHKDNSDLPTDPEACSFDLASIPTTSWTAATLQSIIEDVEKQQQPEKLTNATSACQFLNLFWGGDIKMLTSKLKAGFYVDIVTHVKKFCSEHITPDTVILSHVKQSDLKQLKNYHVLQDNEVYSELPYKSSWLNVNWQLDDIDKAFGFSQSLQNRVPTPECGTEQEEVERIDSIPSQIRSEEPTEVVPQLDLESVDTNERNQASENVSTQMSSPSETESVDSSDAYYSFKIQVLSPDEAKLIYEQTQSEMPQSNNTDFHPEEVINDSEVDEQPRVRDVTVSDSKVENKEVVNRIDQVCCLAMLIAKVSGPGDPSADACECKKKQSHQDCADKTTDEEVVTVQENIDLCVISTDSKFNSAINRDDRAGGNTDDHIATCSTTDVRKDLSPVINLTGDGETPHSCSDEEINDNSHMSINSSWSSVTTESRDEDLITSESEISNHIPEVCFLAPVCEEELVQDQQKSVESCLSTSSEDIKREIKNTQVVSLSDSEEDIVQPQLTSSSLEQPEICMVDAVFSLSSEHKNLKRKRKSLRSHKKVLCFTRSDLDSEPAYKRAKRKNGFVDAPGREPSLSNDRTVELVLYGAALHRPGVTSKREGHAVSASLSKMTHSPPEVLSVKLSPVKRKSSVVTPEYSVRQRIYEKWSSSMPTQLSSIKHRRRQKKHMTTVTPVSGMRLKFIRTADPSDMKEPPVSSERNIRTKHRLSRMKRRLFSNKLRLGENMKMGATALGWSDQEKSKAENESHAVMPLEENKVLRFSVLPNTFNLVDGSTRRKQTSDHVLDNPDIVEGKDKSPNITAKGTRDPWYLPEKKYRPLHLSPVHKTPGLFQEFQKKYKEKTKPSSSK